MFKTLKPAIFSMGLSTGVAAMLVTGFAVAAPANAAVAPAPKAPVITAFGDIATTATDTVSADYKRRYKRNKRYYSNRDYNRGYDNNYRDRRYYDNRRSSYRCDKGNGGLAIGAVAGGLAGHEIAGSGDRTLGAILGAGVGAIAGRAIDRSNDGCR